MSGTWRGRPVGQQTFSNIWRDLTGAASRRSGIRRGALTVAMAAVLVAPLQVSAAIPASAEASGPPPLKGSPEAAAADARRLDKPVEVLDARTESSTTMANPNGSFSLTVTVAPQRVRRADGSWAAVDLDLRQRVGGGIAPAASPADVVFSAGGNGPLARFTDRGRALELGWPGKLPTPTVSGDTATYASVLPDVDLQLRATAFGFSEVLVVKTPEAAKNPALAKIKLSTRTAGVTVRPGSSNGVDVVDGSGERVFRAGTAQMWDSAGTTPSAARKAESGTSAGAAQPPVAEAPPEGAHKADMATQVGPDSLTLVPDQSMLTSPTTKFPVYIDPTFTKGRTGYAYIDKAHAGTVFWNKSEDPRVGKDPDDGVTIRSMFAMDTRPLPKGAYVDQAIFTITGTWTPQWSCSVKPPVDLWRVGAINGNETWNNFADSSKWVSKQDSASVSLGHDGCGVRPVEFSALGVARSAAEAGWDVTTVGLRSPNETDTDYWKRFKLDPKLTITYNRRPNVPSQMKVESKTCTSSPWPAVGKLSGRQAPWLQATVSDPDGDSIKRTEYEWGTYDPATKAMSKLGGTFDETDHSSGAISKLQVPPSTGDLANGTYYWKARGYDGWASAEQGIGNWSNPCYFTVDQTVPDETVSITPAINEDGTGPTYTADTWGGGVGTAGRFTIATPMVGDSNDVVRYKWALGSDQPTTLVAAGTDNDRTVTISVAPSSFGPVVLYVKGEDAAGNPTSLASYTFNVNPPDCPDGVSKLCPEMAAGYWRLNEGSSTISQDASGKNRPLVFGTGTSWATGRLGKAVQFNGSTGCGTTQSGIASCNATGGTSKPVVRTDQSFTVSAWVNLRILPTRNVVFLAQGGSHNSAFALYYKYVDASTRYWGFIMTRPDVTSTTPGYEARRALSAADQAPTTGWVHLTGVYDSNAGTLRLYVNGIDVTDSDVDQPNGFHQTWNAPGSLQVGRTFYNDHYTDWHDGMMQDVHVFPGALDLWQILDEADPSVRT